MLKDKFDDILLDIECFFRDKFSKRCRKCPGYTSDWNAFENDGDCGCVFKDDFTCMWAMDDFEIKCAWWILPRWVTRIFANKKAQRRIKKEVESWEDYAKSLNNKL